MSTFSQAQKRGFFIMFVVIVLGISVFTFHNSLGLANRVLSYSEERDRYLALEFIPKYKINECVVRFDLHLNETKGQFNVAMHNSFDRYISYNEPSIGVMVPLQIGVVSNPETPDIRNIVQYNLIFSNQCDRKFEIFQSMSAYAEDLHSEIFSIKQVPVEEPIESGNIYWTDSPDYDPNYWPTFHRAMRGDGEALLAMVGFQKPNDYQGKHLYMALAEFHLPNGPLKDKAQRGKADAFKKMFSSQQKQANKVIENWKHTIQKYQSE